MASILIIGGGPAGSIAALLLARGGFDVQLFEQHLFPRDKVCGECLSGLGTDVLRRAGVLEELEGYQPAQLVRSLLHPMDGPTIELALPRASMGITRLRMDVVLLEAARQAGVVVQQPARCESIESAEPRRFNVTNATECSTANRGATPPLPVLVWREMSTNTVHRTPADWIVVADGKGALMNRTTRPTGDLGIKTHFAHVSGPSDAIELFAGRGHYGGLAAVENHKWNAAFSVPAKLVKEHGGDLQKVFDQVVSTNSTLQERMSGAERVGPWLASPLPRFAVGSRWPNRVVPIGNAAAALEPVGGEGMGLALRSAELAANAILKSHREGTMSAVQNLPSEYNRLWQVRRTICRGIAIMFSSEYLADAVAPLMAANIGIPSALMRMAGKAHGV